MADAGLPSLVVRGAANRRYVSGFTGSEGTLVVTAEDAYLVTDGRYLEQAASQSPHFVPVRQVGGAWASVRDLVNGLGVAVLAVEGSSVTLADDAALTDGLRARRVVAPPLVERLRAVKDDDEIAALTRAAQVAERALAVVLAGLAPGVREVDVARALDVALLEAGADGRAFAPIVASGPRASMPHAAPGERRLARGELVTIDFGAVVDGYASDCTRTVALGVPDASLADLHALVRDAQDAAIAAVGPGRTGADVDRAARGRLCAAGHGGHVGHAVGHGVGLEVHELPHVARGSRDVLAPGMVVTVEPGVYLPGVAGARVEDMLLVTAEGARPLTTSDRSLLRLG